jgi:hypothetical protein
MYKVLMLSYEFFSILIRSLIWSEAFCLHVSTGGGVQDFLLGSYGVPTLHSYH